MLVSILISLKEKEKPQPYYLSPFLYDSFTLDDSKDLFIKNQTKLGSVLLQGLHLVVPDYYYQATMFGSIFYASVFSLSK